MSYRFLFISTILLVILLSFTNVSMARKPAIDPVIGIGIDDKPAKTPTKVRFFDFKNKDNVSGKNSFVPKKTNDIRSTSDLEENDGNFSLQALLIFLILLLPFGLWFGMIYRLKSNERATHIDPITTKEDFDPELAENEEEEEEDEIDYPKAS